MVVAGKARLDIAAAEVCPVALAFNTEHPGAGLPAIADLATGRAAARIMATFVGDEHAGGGHCIPALAARTPATVGADVETAPVIDRGDHRRRLGVRTRSEIGSSGRSREGNESNRPKQKLLHFKIPSSCSLPVGPEAFSSKTRAPRRWVNQYADSTGNAVSEMQHSRTKCRLPQVNDLFRIFAPGARRGRVPAGRTNTEIPLGVDDQQVAQEQNWNNRARYAICG